MQLVLIYGPPGVGKLTVAQELSELNKYPIFHNHLTVDIAKTLFDDKTKEFEHYRDKLRYETFEIAAKNNVNIIFTFCYSPCKYDDNFINKVIEIVGKYKGEVKFVYLTADKKEIEKRIIEESRKKYHKIKDINILKEAMIEGNDFPKISFVKSLEIDNSNLNAKDVAKKIYTWLK